jgi:hypothetical protein
MDVKILLTSPQNIVCIFHYTEFYGVVRRKMQKKYLRKVSV